MAYLKGAHGKPIVNST